MKKLLISTLLLTSLNLFGSDLSDRRNDLIKVIDEELNEVSRLTKQTNGRNPEFILRLAELQFEKAKLIKENENEKYLAIPDSERAKVNKDTYFKGSKVYFSKAQKAAEFLLKRYKNFKGTADVYYIMAFNAKEFNDEKKAKRYLELSLKNSSGNSAKKGDSLLALGDTAYNEKKYAQAINYYQEGLKINSSDNWWTKYAFNLSWCYLRVNKYDPAISLMKRVYEMSKDKRFVDMSGQVKRDIGYFYAMAGKIDDAIAFYESIGADITHQFIKLSQYLVAQGKTTLAERTLMEAYKGSRNVRDKVLILSHLQEVYEKFGNYSKHLKMTKELANYYKNGDLSKEESTQFLYQVKNMASLLQRGIVGKKKKGRTDINMDKAKSAVEYFDLLIEINNDTAHVYNFHAGETLFSAKDYKGALSYYDKSYKLSSDRGDKKTEGMALEGMMASLGKAKLSKNDQDKYLEYSYKAYIKANPNNKQSFLIHQRLFNLYVKQNNFVDAEKTLYLFKSHYPTDYKTQEAMLAGIMDNLLKAKNKDELIKWVEKINQGEFKISKKYSDSVKSAILNLKFENVEAAVKSGDKKKALIGYLEIYQKSKTDSVSKRNALYNIAVILHEIGQVDRNYEYSLKALDELTIEDLIKYQESFMTFSFELFSRRRFDKSADLSNKLFDKFCKIKSKNTQSLFKNTYVTYLAIDMVDKATEVVDKAEKCLVSKDYLAEGNLEILKTLSEKRDWKQFGSRLSKLKNSYYMYPYLIEPIGVLRDAYLKLNKNDIADSLADKINFYYKESSKKKLNIPLEARDIVAGLEINDLENEIKAFERVELKFPENIYNTILTQKFKSIDKITNKALSIFKIGSGDGIVRAYSLLAIAYENFSNEVKNFTPPDKNNEYVVSFKKAMEAIYGPLMQKSLDFKKEGKSQIYKQGILSSDNLLFTTDLNLPFAPRFIQVKNGVLMDRGGVK